VQRLEHLDELVTEPILERHLPAVHPAWHEEDLLVLDVHAFHLADALGEREGLRLAERRRREPATVALPDDRRVQALLDGGPDRERGREVVALDLEVRTVAYAHLVDVAEQVVGGVAREHIGRARLGAQPDEGEQPPFDPCVGHRELVVAELLPDLLVRMLRVRFGERHGHVHIGDPGVERPLEDRHHETRIGGVHDHVAAMCARRLGDLRGIGRVEPGGREPAARPVPVDDALPLGLVDVGEDDALVEVTTSRDRREGRPYPPAADHQDPHVARAPSGTDEPRWYAGAGAPAISAGSFGRAGGASAARADDREHDGAHRDEHQEHGYEQLH
jgi:hypothetical protein